MKYNVTTKGGKKVFGGEEFGSQKAAKQALIDAIKGASNKDAFKYIDLKIKKK